MKKTILVLLAMLFVTLSAHAQQPQICGTVCNFNGCFGVPCPASWQWNAAEVCSPSEAFALAAQAEGEFAIVKTKDSMPRYIVFTRVFADSATVDGPLEVRTFDTLTDATMAHNAESEPNKGAFSTASGPSIFWKATGSMNCQ